MAAWLRHPLADASGAPDHFQAGTPNDAKFGWHDNVDRQFGIGDAMTTPAPETIAREQGKLYVSDAELIRRIGVPEKYMRKILPGLESNYGFPRKQPLFDNRRYWPAVKAWLDKRNGLTMGPQPVRRQNND
jgi:hypothetical protein